MKVLLPIAIAHGSIFQFFFTQQGRHIPSIIAKFGMAEGTEDPDAVPN